MSMFMVDKIHIDAMVTAALAWELCVIEKATEIGRMLWQANLDAAHHRYPGLRVSGDYPGPLDFTAEQVPAYEFELVPGRVDPRVVGFMGECLDYQCDEPPEWDTSLAREWIAHLREVAQRIEPIYTARYGPLVIPEDLNVRDIYDRDVFCRLEAVAA